MDTLLKNRIVTVVGGSGFLGRYVVRLLAEQGYQIRVLVRNTDNALYLKTAGDVGQVTIVCADITRPESLHGRLDHSFAVINLAGILFEGGSQKFQKVQAEGAEQLARLAKTAGAQHFIQLSALGVDKALTSRYAATKLAGEQAVRREFPGAVILRPSLLFGAEDQFFNKFAAMACLAPALPLIGGGKTRFQPVYVADVAKAVIQAMAKADYQGQIFELGGPHVYSFRELLQFINHTIHRKTCLLPVPFGIARMIGTFGQLLPVPPLTADQVTLLQYDNIVSEDAKTFADLDIEPQSVKNVVPFYLARFVKKAS